MSLQEAFNQTQEQVPKQETHVKLHFFRHAKQRGLTADEKLAGLTDKDRPLEVEDSKGMMYAKSLASTDTNTDQTVAYGSPRIRSQQTAMLKAYGAENDFEGATTYEEMKDYVNEGRAVGSKIGQDDRLNFNEGGAEFNKAMNDAYEAGEYLPWIINESDQVAKDNNDKEASSYTRQAGNIAQIIKKWMQASGNWNKIFSESKNDTNEQKYDDNTLERFFGSHQGVCESFLLRYVEKTEGVEIRNELLNSIGGGFNFVQGFDLDIVDDANGNKITTLTFNVPGATAADPTTPLVIPIDQDVLNELINDAEESRK